MAAAAAIVTPRAIARGMGVAAALLALTGCIGVYVATPPPGGYPEVVPIDLAVGLVLGHELRTAAIGSLQSDGSAGPAFHVGGALAESAETVCREVFTKVVVGDTPPQGVDLLVFARVASGRTTRPVNASEDVPLTVVLEWKVVTPRERLVWLESVRGSGAAPMGLPFFGIPARNATRRLDAVFHGLFLQSHAALAGSPEIRAYAAQVALAEGAE